MVYFFGTPTPALAERARQAADKALGLAPDRSEAFAARGFYEQLVVGDAKRALEYFAKGQHPSRHPAPNSSVEWPLQRGSSDAGTRR